MIFQNKDIVIKHLTLAHYYDAQQFESRGSWLQFKHENGVIHFSQYKLGKYQGHWYTRFSPNKPGDNGCYNFDLTPEELSELAEISKVLNSDET